MGLRESEITENTTLRAVIRVTKSDTTPKSLVGATFAAVMGRRGTQRAGAVTLLDPAKGIVQVAFPAATGLAGQIIASLHVTLNGETQCVWRERLQVLPNLEP